MLQKKTKFLQITHLLSSSFGRAPTIIITHNNQNRRSAGQSEHFLHTAMDANPTLHGGHHDRRSSRSHQDSKIRTVLAHAAHVLAGLRRHHCAIAVRHVLQERAGVAVCRVVFGRPFGAGARLGLCVDRVRSGLWRRRQSDPVRCGIRASGSAHVCDVRAESGAGGGTECRSTGDRAL